MTQRPNPKHLQPAVSPGLDGVVVAATRLSQVNGADGALTIAGRSIEDLAGAASFEEAVALLWAQTGISVPQDPEEAFGIARQAAWPAVQAMAARPDHSPIALVQTGLAALGTPGTLHPAVAVTGAFPVLVAAAARLTSGQEPLAPDITLSSAADFLQMLTGDLPPLWAVQALDRYLVTVLDHGLNASTFAARVIASTEAGIKDAVIGGLAALKGPLHGGAPGPVLDMLDAIATPGHADQWIAAELDAGRRLMGFGHRIYRTRDPRADVLKMGVRSLPKTERLALAEAVEAAALSALKTRKSGRPLDTNVEFYTAVLLDGIGLDRDLFTPVFAMGRSAGWCAHAAEQHANGKLIRPSSEYIGPKPS